MGDKNPKHPLKKKKVAAKTNDVRTVEVQTGSDTAPKSKKHTY